jgi:hypothetical protein
VSHNRFSKHLRSRRLVYLFLFFFASPFIHETLGRRDDVHINDIRDGKISFAYEGMDRFPHRLVEVLRSDITHLDLSYNSLRDFDFLRGFKTLKSLIVDGNVRMDMESFPPIGSLELFYANKCNIEFPRSFIFRIAVIFKSLKYLSIMGNPSQRQPSLNHRREGKEHRMRMFAIFMNRHLIHFSDKLITDDERSHSEAYHKYLGPMDCKLSKFVSLPDTDDIRKILPVQIREKTNEILAMEAQDDSDSLDDALASINISQYFVHHQPDNLSIGSYISTDVESAASSSRPSSVDTFTTDEGLGSMAPSEKSFE